MNGRKGLEFIFFFLFAVLFNVCLEKGSQKEESRKTDVVKLVSDTERRLVEKSEKVISNGFISGKLRDEGFREVRAYIPEYAILGCDKVKLESKFKR
ncbi:hypothetical protein HRbin19_01030 [bacterium HR19]|nr:hypothetical protein HRbin19_01030 [bacterium HR19]